MFTRLFCRNRMDARVILSGPEGVAKDGPGSMVRNDIGFFIAMVRKAAS